MLIENQHCIWLRAGDLTDLFEQPFCFGTESFHRRTPFMSRKPAMTARYKCHAIENAGYLRDNVPTGVAASLTAVVSFMNPPLLLRVAEDPKGFRVHVEVENFRQVGPLQ